MENPLLANSSALDIADNCLAEDCEVSTANLAVAECVLRILDNGIAKIQVSMVIPIFLNNEELLKQCLSRSQYQKCITYYNEYMEYAERMQDTNPKEFNIALIELIDLFCENRNIRQILPEYISKIDPVHTELINNLIQLRQIAEVRLKTTAIVEMRREKAVHRIYQDNENAVKSLAKQKKTLRDQEINLRWKLAAKQTLIKKYEEDLAAKKWENNLKINQEILKSSHTIGDIHTKSLLKQEQLANSVEKAKIFYANALRDNAKIEKEFRDEKNKLLLQLQGLIKKYDQNVGDKIQENQELQKVYDEQRRQLDEFLVGYTAKEDEYNQLAQKKLGIENAEFERKLYLFMATRAVKVLQRYWRKYLKTLRKQEAKEKGIKVGKGDKGKKKKK